VAPRPLLVFFERSRRIHDRVRRYLQELYAARQVLLQLEEERGVKRARLVARRVESGDDEVLARCSAAVEGVAELVLQAEGGHGDELARQLAEAEVHLVVARVGGARDELACVDAEEDGLDLSRAHDHRQGCLFGAQAHTVVCAHRDRQRQELALGRRRRHVAR